MLKGFGLTEALFRLVELRLGVYGAESDFSGFGSGFVAGIALKSLPRTEFADYAS